MRTVKLVSLVSCQTIAKQLLPVFQRGASARQFNHDYASKCFAGMMLWRKSKRSRRCPIEAESYGNGAQISEKLSFKDKLLA